MKIKLYDKYFDLIKEVDVTEEPVVGDYIREKRIFFKVCHIVRSKKGNEFIVEISPKLLKPVSEKDLPIS